MTSCEENENVDEIEATQQGNEIKAACKIWFFNRICLPFKQILVLLFHFTASVLLQSGIQPAPRDTR